MSNIRDLRRKPMPKLSICVPTRNRQKYCIETLKGLAQSPETDVEFVVYDNSDDATILRDFFDTELADDTRFRLIPPEDVVLSMVDNWERMIPYTEGEWLAVIGDDDHIDSELAGVIKRIERNYSGVEALSWARMTYNWPDNRPFRTTAGIPVHHQFFEVEKKKIQDMFYRWTERRPRPSCGFGIYHAACTRKLMERIKTRFSGRYFEHPVVDFDNACKVINEARKLVSCARPLSVLGACAASNSAGLFSRKRMEKRLQAFVTETKNPYQLDDFPFEITNPPISLMASIAGAIYYFCSKYDIDLTGWEENFVHACMADCSTAHSPDEFVEKMEAYVEALAVWKDGKWLDTFNPVYIPGSNVNTFAGYFKGDVFLDESKIDAATPKEFYEYSQAMIVPIDHIKAGVSTFAR